LGANDLQELKDDIKCLDQKLDKNEVNMNKRLEKNEENMNKFMETTVNAINKLSDAIMEMKLVMIKDYVEKEDLEKLDTRLNEKIEENNNNRKKYEEKINIRIDMIEKDNSIKFNEILRYIFFICISSGVTYLITR